MSASPKPSHPVLFALALALAPAARAMPASPQAGATPAAATAKVAGDIEPTPAQAAAIRHAAAGDLADCERDCYTMSLADLNDDGRPDLLVYYTSATQSGYCGTAGCGGSIVMATPRGYAGKAIELPGFHEMDVLPGTHHGMHDLQFDRDSPVWRWNGSKYDIARANLPGADAQPWQTRAAAGRTLAVAVPVDSAIRTLSVFCDQGRPVLAMLLKARPSAKPVTLTWIFRGWTVNVPMGRGNRDATLWLADLSRSALPRGAAPLAGAPRRHARHARTRTPGHRILSAHRRRHAGPGVAGGFERRHTGRVARLLSLLIALLIAAATDVATCRALPARVIPQPWLRRIARRTVSDPASALRAIFAPAFMRMRHGKPSMACRSAPGFFRMSPSVFLLLRVRDAAGGRCRRRRGAGRRRRRRGGRRWRRSRCRRGRRVAGSLGSGCHLAALAARRQCQRRRDQQPCRD